MKSTRYARYAIRKWISIGDKKVVVFFVEGKRYSVVMVPTDNKDLAYRNDSLKAALAN